MAEATDTRSTPEAQRESARQHPDDNPYGLFETGENVHIIKRWHELAVDFHSEVSEQMHFAAEVATNVCTSLDGIATKLEYALGCRIANLNVPDHEERAVAWQMIEVLALATSVIDLHRIRRLGAEAQP